MVAIFPASNKASGGVCIAFPDVCKIPTPPASITPIAYPNIAKTAQAAQKASKVPAASKIPAASASKATAIGGSKVDVSGEIAQLKSALNQLNAKLMGLQSDDPNKWQEVLSEYCVAASALYVTTIHNIKA